ncbi:MAG: CPBP family intramembrane glutamic endopeptidase [Acidobacteriota bacterium]
MSDSEAGFEEPRNPQEMPQSPQEPEPSGYLWHPIERPAPLLELVPPPPKPPKLIPNIGNVVVFLLLLIPAFIGGYLVALFSIYAAHPHVRLAILMQEIGRNVMYAISMQAASYIVLWGLAGLVFSLWWDRPFAEGIHWNLSVATRWFLLFAGLGVVTGLAITIAGNFLPMPKAPPILEDLTKSAAGAWTLMAFGVTLAPLTEELAFRGFLLPSLVNIFRWLERRHAISESTVRVVGLPLAIVLTSIPFALMHSQQVSNSWGPVLLIGCVSVLLCIIRLTTDSVAAGVLVHACYNLTLFSGLLYQTDWFRHLDKLKT